MCATGVPCDVCLKLGPNPGACERELVSVEDESLTG